MQMKARTRRWNVWLCDEQARDAVPRAKVFHLVQNLRASSVKNLFVFCSAIQLPEVSQLISSVNRRNQLLALFLRQDADLEWLPQLLDRANLRAIRNLMVHEDLELPRRVLTAWQYGAENELIARAMVAGDRLFVTSCVPETFEIEFGRMPALARLPKRARPDFVVSEDGSYIHWPSRDVHLSLAAIRCVLDPTYGERRAASRIARGREWGVAVAKLRKECGLRQVDIEGLSERQLRRIESGEHTSSSSLKKLAAAHRMEFSTYLDEVARRIGGDFTGATMRPL